jgi:transposase
LGERIGVSDAEWALIGPLFRMLADRIEALLADKGYDAGAIRAEIEAAGVEAVIPAKSNRRVPIPHDREKHRWRNLVARLFSKPKNWRRVATRYDKTQESYLGFVALASIKLWIPLVHEASIICPIYAECCDDGQ